MIGVGLDFGTTNSTVAWFDGKELNYVKLEQESPILPSALHLNRRYSALTGSAAVAQYVEENRGRRVELVAEVLGEQTVSVGEGRNPTTVDSDRLRRVVHGALIDRGQQGRLFQELKRLLGDRSTERLMVFERPYRLVALITPILERMRGAVERALASPVADIHLGRPVNFEGKDARRNEVATARLGEAAEHAGFRAATFYLEPVAATLSYLWRAAPKSRGVALTVDFGGGTLDLSVIQYDGTEFEVLATAGVGLGGNRIDQMIYSELLFPLLGKGETWTRTVDGEPVTVPFPFEEYEAGLLNWATSYLLNQNVTRTKVLARLAEGGRATEKFERLNDLITFNYSYNCFQAIRQAKAALSEVNEVTLDIPELNLAIAFTRERLDQILEPVLKTLAQLVDEVIAKAGLRQEQIDLVIRTGGTSEIVAVKRLLEEAFPGKVAGHDPFTSVAGGLAIADYHGYEM